MRRNIWVLVALVITVFRRLAQEKSHSVCSLFGIDGARAAALSLARVSTATSLAMREPSTSRRENAEVLSTPNGLCLLNGQSIPFALGGTPGPFHLLRFAGTF